MTPRARPARVSAPGSVHPAPRLPRLFADPLAWLAALPVALLVARLAGAPLGEPVADDFGFLRSLQVMHARHLFDGGGLPTFWRPLSRQLYYSVLGPLMLTHPLWVSALHAAMLAGAAMLLFGAFREAVGRRTALAIAGFPLLAEGARALIAWPANMQDVGAYFLTALAFYLLSRGRWVASFAALLAALLCKEVAVVAVALVPILPSAMLGRARFDRRRLALGSLVVLVLWGAGYVLALQWGGARFPQDLIDTPEARAAGPVARFLWSLRWSLGDVLSLAGVPEAWVLPLGGTAASLAVLGLGVGMWRGPRGALLASGAWGALWFLAVVGLHTSLYPYWTPSRTLFAMLGLGIGGIPVLAAAHRTLPLALVVLRAWIVLACPSPPPGIALQMEDTGGRSYLGQLVRVQRLAAGVREELARGPALPAGARVVQRNFPRLVEASLWPREMLVVCTRDTSARWVKFDEWRRDPTARVDAVLEFQPRGARSIVRVEPGAMRALFAGLSVLRDHRTDEALVLLATADSLQRDRDARVFLATVAGKRALVLLDRRDAGAEAEARRALAMDADNLDAWLALAEVRLGAGRVDESLAALDSLLARRPDDAQGLELLARATAPPVAKP